MARKAIKFIRRLGIFGCLISVHGMFCGWYLWGLWGVIGFAAALAVGCAAADHYAI